MQRYTLAAVAVLLVLLPSQQALQADQALYTIEDLGRTTDGLAPTVTGVNAAGQLSGNVNSAAGSRAVRYTDGHGWEYLPGLEAGNFSVANGINASGDLVGYRFTPAGELRAFRYRDGSGVEDIAPMPGGSMTLGYGINAAGDVVGYGDSSAGFVSFKASLGLPAVALPSLGGGFSLACGVNDAGQVAGFSFTADGFQHAVRIDPGSGPIDVGSFDGPSGFSTACAIDANGRIGGQASDHGVGRAFAYAGNFLGNLDSFASSGSNTEGIASGRSVGWFVSAADGTLHAFTQTDQDGSIDLNTLIPQNLGWMLSQAKGVTPDGHIVGEGLLNGVVTTFRLTPLAKDTTPPVFTSLTATPSIIWPPKGQKVSVTVSATATDDSGAAPVCKLANISGPGVAGIDFDVTGADTATVLAVGGRTYTMNELCVDAANNTAWSSVDVTVPPDTTAPVIGSLSANPSRIWPPNDALVPVVVAVSATDDVDDQPSCALTGIAASGATADDYAIRGAFSAVVRAVGGRTYSLTVTCADVAGNHSASAVTVVVPPDTTAPVISDLSATPSTIWPPNGKMVPVTVSVTANDDVDAAPSCALTSVTGGESVITGQFTASVRATKTNDDYDRYYTLKVSCSDRAHNTSTRSVTVTVTKDDPSYSATPKAKGPKH